MDIEFDDENRRFISECSVEDALKLLETNLNGLSEKEAENRLRKFGLNEISEVKGEPIWKKILSQFTHFFAILLWVAAILSLIAKMPELTVAIIVVILINGVFSFWQEYKAEKAAEELKKLLPYQVKVLRDGEVKQIDAKYVVPGDIVLIAEGDRIPADLRLIEASDLQVDASVLTGESKPVRKEAGKFLLGEEPIINAKNLCFAGTNVVSGSGRGLVYATGMNTEFGKIAALTQTIEKEMSPLQKELIFVTRVIAAIAVFMGVVFFFLGILFAGLPRFDAFIFAIGIIVANVPEGLLPTVTLALALAVQKMASENALVKKLSSIETLGSCNVICTDKTGTLTKNEMTVKKIWVGEELEVTGAGYEPQGELLFPEYADEESKKSLLENIKWLGLISALCNNSKLKETDKGFSVIGDPTEGALLVLSKKIELDGQEENYSRLREIPFTSARKRMTVIVKSPEKKIYAFTKGAPEVVLERCKFIILGSKVIKLDEETKRKVIEQVEEYSNQAFRVMGFAFKEIEATKNIYTLEPEEIESELCFVGLVAMYDPPRPEVEEAVKKCREAGIRVIMITGDHGLTALAVAKKIGIADDQTPQINGPDLDRYSNEELKNILKQKSCIFARVTPEHKLQIVSLLKELDEIVAVTGDGVNDAPALKRADIGVAMGITGTDVAKEAADMILLDDNFATIVKAIEEGRAVFDNIRRFITYIFASNIPEIVPYLVFVLSGGKIPLPLTVLQILAVDVGTDLVPALALGTEPPEKDVMKRPPRKRTERLLTPAIFARAYGFLGIIEAIACMTSFFYAYVRSGWSIGLPLASSGITYLKARTMCLASIITSQVGNGFACRTTKESIFSKGFLTNRFYLVGIMVELVLINIFIYVSFFQKLFGHTPLDLKDWLFLIIWPPILLLADEARKAIVRIMDRYKKKS